MGFPVSSSGLKRRIEKGRRDLHLCSLASSLTSCPAFETSLPAPSTVLQALRNEEAPITTTRLANVMARYLRMVKSFCHGRAKADTVDASCARAGHTTRQFRKSFLNLAAKNFTFDEPNVRPGCSPKLSVHVYQYPSRPTDRSPLWPAPAARPSSRRWLRFS